MKLFPLALGTLALTITGCAHDTTSVAGRGEARLAELIAGRVPGEARSCISAFAASRLQVIDETALVYDARDTIWVARPAAPMSLDADDILVIERTGGQLCKQDVIRTLDRHSGFPTGVVFLGDFVPYRRN